VDGWRRTFIEKLGKAQTQCARRFEEAVEAHVGASFEELAAFLRDNGFKVSSPVHESGRQSYKFELAENAYVLLIFRFSNVGEFELRSETFIPGRDPLLSKSLGRVADIDAKWAEEQFRCTLDRFVELLGANAGVASGVAKQSDESVEELTEELAVA